MKTEVLRTLGLIFIATSIVAAFFVAIDSQSTIMDDIVGGTGPGSPATYTFSTKGEQLNIEVRPQSSSDITVFFDGEQIAPEGGVVMSDMGVHNLRIESSDIVTFRLTVESVRVSGPAAFIVITYALIGGVLLWQGRK